MDSMSASPGHASEEQTNQDTPMGGLPYERPILAELGDILSMTGTGAGALTDTGALGSA